MSAVKSTISHLANFFLVSEPDISLTRFGDTTVQTITAQFGSTFLYGGTVNNQTLEQVLTKLLMQGAGVVMYPHGPLNR